MRQWLLGVAMAGATVAAVFWTNAPAAASLEFPPMPPSIAKFLHLAPVGAPETPVGAVMTTSLSRSELIEALRAGGLVVYFRHARTDWQQKDTNLSQLADCAAQRNLSAEGREQARRIGAKFQEHGIPVGDVLSSQFCRTRDTAALAFGQATPVEELTYFNGMDPAIYQQRLSAIERRLATSPAPGVNTMLVGHKHDALAALSLEAEAEAAVFRPDGQGGYHLLGNLKAEDW